MRILLAMIVSGLLAAPVVAQEVVAQALPKAELGLQLSMSTEDNGSISGSPRLTFNVTPLTAFEVTMDVRNPGTEAFGTRTSGQSAGVHLRQALLSSDRWHLFGVVGAGATRRVISAPGFRFTETDPVGYIGQTVQVDAAPWLALRADVRLTVGESPELRGMLGGVVPLGRVSTPGTRRQALAATDSLGNGLAIGAVSGAVGGGLLFGWAGSVLCEDDPCDTFTLKAAAFGTASGAVVGGLLGAVVDSLFKGQRAVQVTPVAGPSTRGGHVTVRWR
jgi:hypothetical protein